MRPSPLLLRFSLHIYNRARNRIAFGLAQFSDPLRSALVSKEGNSAVQTGRAASDLYPAVEKRNSGCQMTGIGVFWWYVAFET